jgi:GTP-binding protein
MLLFIVDGRSGLTAQDKAIAERLRRTGRPLLLVVNKAEGMERAIVGAEFHELACGEPLVISAAHGDGVRELVEEALAPFPEAEEAVRKVGLRASPSWAGPTSASPRSSMRCSARSA